ncbi:hypothetical protein WA026_016223 [Henosepilachna vigintioctopunctata]|uniref:Uncharacterized protein n=1 Tax=Henosepilachna vigintioctopunctata TaxID=420089 RepID=A0AAW1TPB3_9CUCU
MSWGGIVVIVLVIPFCINVKLNGTIFDFAEIQSTVHTDSGFPEQLHKKNNNYKFEDFFWTGSGDGPYDKDNEPWVIEPPKTVYRTTTATVTTTIYTNSTSNKQNETTKATPKCNENCGTLTSPGENILPTPRFDETTASTDPSDIDNSIDADREFWIITVFKTNGRDPELKNLKNSLVKLYKKAFQRQQERHLGINNKRKKRKTGKDKPVNVYIHQVDKKNLNGVKEVEILYHVAVSGKPIAAKTAVDDMRLISDDEVRQELGFPILIKAEPYIKPAEYQSLSKAKNTWLFIGVSIISLLILLLLVAFLTLGCTKRKRPSSGIDNRQQVFERGVEEIDKNLQKTDGVVRRRIEPSPTYINFQNQPSTESIRSVLSNKSAAYLSPSTSSSTSLDISPLMKVKKTTPPKKPPRPKAALNKTVPINLVKIPPELYDSESNGSRRNSEDTIFIGNFDPGVASPKSYLSMPSVKSFPRIKNPEPLNKVLEPVSMLHLDMPEDTEIEIRHGSNVLARHGSVGTNADPGVIGPIVWDIHCQRLQHGVSLNEGIDDLAKNTKNATKMRKRFHDLLDDTFSLFGSRTQSPVEETASAVTEGKSKSAGIGNIRNDENVQPTLKPRPRTSFSRKAESNTKPKGAWTSSTPSPLVRPLSAGILAPRLNVEHIQAEGKFSESDPAIPLIAAIKTELQKCTLPGSTTDLNK